jgi:hypothetical protein
MASPNAHDKRIEEMLEKARGLGATDGYEWAVRTKFRMLGQGQQEEVLEAGKAEDIIIKIGVFKGEPARVVVQKGLTMNLGNYESARVTVGFECPCYAEELAEIEALLNQKVEDRVQQEVMEVRGRDIRPGYEAKRTETK